MRRLPKSRPTSRRLAAACRVLAFILGPSLSAQVTINVPADQPTIQAGIVVAVSGDTVLVSPGTYLENIDFLGKDIVVQSTDGPVVTMIDGSGTTSCVTFKNAEGPGAALDGFTLTNGLGTLGAGDGGGVVVYPNSGSIKGARPTIRNNIISGCSAAYGGGIYSSKSAPTIVRNVIYGNTATGQGGGIAILNPSVGFAEVPIVDHNTVFGNSAGNGAGIGVWTNATPVILNTIAWGNNGPMLLGGATVSYSDIQGGWPGTGNISEPPLFADALAGDFSLLFGSPCIDAGDPASPLDPDGTVVEMGAVWFYDPWIKLGDGLAGSAGLPQLVGTGGLLGNDPVALDLTNAKPFALSFLVLGLSNLSIPFKGGVLVPAPDFLLPLTVDGFGVASLSTLWPAGVPSGATFYSQFWISDAAGPAGFAASNALSGTTP